MTNLILRPARPEDAAAFARIRSDWVDATPWLPRLATQEEFQRSYRDHMIPEREVIVAEAEGSVQGYLALDRDSDEITALFVGPKGRGIGAALLAAAKQRRKHLFLWTFQANAAARRFYWREGFREGERTEGDNDVQLPDVQLLWDRAAT